ncbi:hypothetical protein C8Q75DRAFT_728974 [Abortiporus biennis]|nr:hypothetical protein C8Q75DRAFT_728974 [Abortiporus biennis]
MTIPIAASQRNRIELNFDTLYLVMKQLETRFEILSVMKTCRILHYHGTPLMLHHRISLGLLKSPQHENLWEFLRKHPRTLQYIEEVETSFTSGWDDDPHLYRHAIQLFQIILGKCFNLKELEISSYYFTGMSVDGIKSRRDICDELYLLLKRLTAPIAMLSLSFNTEFISFVNSTDYPVDVHPKDPLPLLVNFASTLEVLDVSWCDWADRSGRRTAGDVIKGLLPCRWVHTLKSYCGDGSPSLMLLMLIFPNLRNLQVFSDKELNENFASIHRINLFVQEAFALSCARIGTRYLWESLEELNADPRTLYALALTRTKVNRLEVMSGCDSTDIRHYLHITGDLSNDTAVTSLNDIGQEFKSNQEHIMGRITYRLPSLQYLSTHQDQCGNRRWESFKGWRIFVNIEADEKKIMRENLDERQRQGILREAFGSFTEFKPT